jgi:hypothetical protein
MATFQDLKSRGFGLPLFNRHLSLYKYPIQ